MSYRYSMYPCFQAIGPAAPFSSIMRLSKSISSQTQPTHKPNSFFNVNSVFHCKHSPLATLDLLIFFLVLFSCVYLVASYFSYIFNSVSLLLTSRYYISPSSDFDYATAAALGFILLFFISLFVLLDTLLSPRSRRCDRLLCKGLKNAMEFDLLIQNEDFLRARSLAVVEIDRLPRKGGREDNPDYDCLRVEPKKMAPSNSRAILLFRSKCGARCQSSKAGVPGKAAVTKGH